MEVIPLEQPNERQEGRKSGRRRDIFIRFMVDEQERDLIYRRMEQSGIKSLRAYLLKQATSGRIVHVRLDSVNEMCRLLANATNNINQIAKRVNQTGNFYAADLNDLQMRYDELWTQTKEILRRLASI
jgi:hypothetical protein